MAHHPVWIWYTPNHWDNMVKAISSRVRMVAGPRRTNGRCASRQASTWKPMDEMNAMSAIFSGQRNVKRFWGCTSRMQMYHSKNRNDHRPKFMPSPGGIPALTGQSGLETSFPLARPL